MAAEVSSVGSLEVTTRLLGNGHGDVVFDSKPCADLVLLHVDEAHREQLEQLAAAGAGGRPPLPVARPGADSDLMRAAIRSGALDFLPEPIAAADVESAI